MTNNRLGLEYSTGANTLAYFGKSNNDEEKNVLTLTPGNQFRTPEQDEPWTSGSGSCGFNFSKIVLLKI
jgi:hypothetical protein